MCLFGQTREFLDEHFVVQFVWFGLFESGTAVCDLIKMLMFFLFNLSRSLKMT